MPLNDFYTYEILETGKNSISSKVIIDPNHDVYKGHFPEQPITPGVILIEIIRSILSKHLKKDLILKTAKELKFTAPVIPTDDTEILLSIDFEVIDGTYKTSCKFFSEERTFIKLKGVFRAN